MADPEYQHADNWSAAGIVGMFDSIHRERDRQRHRRILLLWTLAIASCLGLPLWLTWGNYQDARRQTLLEEWESQRMAVEQAVQPHPAITAALKQADALHESSLTKSSAASLADLREGLSLLVKVQNLDRDLHRLRLLLGPLGKTLAETPWHTEAPAIERHRERLYEEYNSLSSLIQHGEVITAEQELAELVKDISQLQCANIEAMHTSRARQAWFRLLHSIPERLLESPTWGIISELGKDAESQWEAGHWYEARTQFTRTTQRAEEFLDTQLQPEEKDRILKNDSDTITQLETERAELLQEINSLKQRINSLNQQLATTNGERQNALTQVETLTAERDHLSQSLAGYREQIEMLQAERSKIEYKYLQEEGKVPVAAGIEFVLIQPGTFDMGSESEEAKHDEKPVHKVTISKPFFAGKYEVTIGQVLRWLNSPEVILDDEWINFDATTSPIIKQGDLYVLNMNSKYGESSRQPMGYISWYGAVAFCDWCSQQDYRFRYRLPTEAEWEYMARAGSTTNFPWGETITHTQANIVGGPGSTTPVGTYTPNAWGLHDTAGTVWEWCSDWYSGSYYAKSPLTDPVGPSSGVTRVIRSGSCFDESKNARSSARHGYNPKYRGGNFGFRVVAE